MARDVWQLLNAKDCLNIEEIQRHTVDRNRIMYKGIFMESLMVLLLWVQVERILGA